MPRIDPADLIMLIAAALVLALALGVWLGRWTQRRQDAPYRAMMRERLHEANREIEELQRLHANGRSQL